MGCSWMVPQASELLRRNTIQFPDILTLPRINQTFLVQTLVVFPTPLEAFLSAEEAPCYALLEAGRALKRCWLITASCQTDLPNLHQH